MNILGILAFPVSLSNLAGKVNKTWTFLEEFNLHGVYKQHCEVIVKVIVRHKTEIYCEF